MEITKRPKISQQLNIAPLIDIVFLLLIFFMLTSTFLRERVVELALPQSDSTATVEDLTIRLTVLSAERYILNGEELSKTELEPALTFLQGEGTEDRPVLLKIDQEQDVQLLVETMDLLRGQGLQNIALATEVLKEEQGLVDSP
jgi:biopolymer transport protein ExbD